MRTIRTLIVEDEQPARERLLRALQTFPEIEVVGEAENGIQAVEAMKTLKPDLVFLDVQIPILNGFEVLQQVHDRFRVIFTTAYDEYALKAFEVNAVDYLLKPYSKERLHTAIRRVLEGASPSIEELARLMKAWEENRNQPVYLQRISIRTKYAYRVLPVTDIDFFKVEKGQLVAVLGEERLPYDGTLSFLERHLDPALFQRVHRNAIANLARVQRIIPWGQGQLAIEFPSGEKLFVGRTKIQSFRRAMGLS
ncbi:MAG: LytTR family DNA-binding domain-containing protein [Spirochaetales bacterium]